MNMRLTRRTLTIICSAAIMLPGIALAACGNPQATIEGTATSGAADGITAVASSPVSTPSELTPPAQVSEPGAAATPQLITPVAAAGVRTDCADDAAAAVEQHFSLCYPFGLRVVRAESDGLVDYNIGSPPTPADEVRQNTFLIAIVEHAVPSFDASKGCVTPDAITTASQQIEFGGRTVQACYSVVRDSDQNGAFELRSLRAEFDAGDRPIEILATYRGPDFAIPRAEIDQILASLVTTG